MSYALAQTKSFPAALAVAGPADRRDRAAEVARRLATGVGSRVALSRNAAGRMGQADRRGKLDLLWHSAGAFMDALWLQPRRMEDEMFQDLRYGARILVKSPGFTFVAALTLALGIGANTAIFSVIEAVMLRPLPYQNSERLCVLWKSVPARNIEWDWTSYPTIRDWREQSRSFEDMAVILRPDGSEVTLQSDAGPERIQGSKVSGNFFQMLGVRPLLGRAFSDEEARRGDDVVVLSYDFWQRRFGGDGAALGRSLKLDNRSVTVIGVMPPSFQFPDKNAQLWLLISADDRWATLHEIRLADAFSALARLKPGVSIEEARADMNAVAGGLAKQYPATDANLGIRVTPLFDQIAGAQLRRALWILGGAVLCVLLIACSNIASLLVARGATRRKELAVRAALGAGRWPLLRQLATENILLSLLGGLGGLLFAQWALRALLALVPEDLPRADGIAINGMALAFTFTLCLLTYHYPHLFSFAPEARREISRWWNHRKARHYCLCAPAGARDRSAVEEISLFRVPSSTPAGVRCIGARFPVVPPPANIHRPFRAKSRNRRTRKMWVMTRLIDRGRVRYATRPPNHSREYAREFE